MSSNGSNNQYSGDIPVLNELASLIGSLGLETPNKQKYKETDESIAAELREVYVILICIIYVTAASILYVLWE
jgi:hypothetical protein